MYHIAHLPVTSICTSVYIHPVQVVVDCRHYVVYHSAHGISNIPPNIRRKFPTDRLPLAGRQSTLGLRYTGYQHYAAGVT
eukprot:1668021-Pyramimonas_sp.AAC.1